MNTPTNRLLSASDATTLELARRVLKNDALDKDSDPYIMAKEIVAKHEAEVERLRKLDEEHRLAKEETARRWPELANDGWVIRYRGFERGSDEAFEYDGNLCIDSCEYLDVPIPVALAILDMNGLNATADKLREAMAEAIEWIDGGDEAAGRGVLSRALEASNV